MNAQPPNAAWGERARHENLWPVRVAIILAALLYLTLPDKLAVGYNYDLRCDVDSPIVGWTGSYDSRC
jgi:hypothetical protein